MLLMSTGDAAHEAELSSRLFFWMQHGETRVRCSVEHEALDAVIPSCPLSYVKMFEMIRATIEQAAGRLFEAGEREPNVETWHLTSPIDGPTRLGEDLRTHCS